MGKEKNKSKSFSFSINCDENFDLINEFLMLQSNRSFSIMTLIANEINKNGLSDLAKSYPAKPTIKSEFKKDIENIEDVKSETQTEENELLDEDMQCYK